jgi:hypothetical protein
MGIDISLPPGAIVFFTGSKNTVSFSVKMSASSLKPGSMSLSASTKPPKYISANQPEFMIRRSYWPCLARTELRCFSSEPANGLTSSSTLLPLSFS